MIIRPLILRHGRIALPRSCTPYHTRRSLSNTPRHLQQQQPQVEIQGSINGELPAKTFEIRDPNHPVAQDWAFYHHQKHRTGDLGTSIAPHYRPHELLSNPPRPQDITLELLMASQAHIGHATSLWHPANAKYIFGVRGEHDPIHIISLDTTAAYLRRACKVITGVTARAGLVLFVGTRAGQARTIVRAAQLSQGCHLFTKWTPGSITNGQQILGSCRKKVVNERDEEEFGFDEQLQTSSAVKPDLVVCLNPLENYILLHECALHNIPTIGIIDTDANPTWVTYPIPANDDSLRCVQVICGALGRAGEEGQQIRARSAKRGHISSQPSHRLEAPTEEQVRKEREARDREMLAAAAYEEQGDVVKGPWAIEEPAEDTLELAAPEGEQLAVDVAEEGSGSMEDLLGSLSEELENQDSSFQPYERDRPLTEEELNQSPDPTR